jgi:ribosome-associated translation inhibitor RaiA
LKLSVTGRRLAISQPHRLDIRRKIARLERVLNDAAVSAQCVLEWERGAFVCELTVHARGDHILHGVGRHARLAPAVTAAVTRVGGQAKRLADRWKKRRKAGA